AFRRRRDRLVERFRAEAPGVEFVEPHGAFYFFFRVDGVLPEGEGSAAFCQRLMEEAGVALVPGAAFGDDRWVRMSYATDDKTLGGGRDGRLAPRAAVRAARAGGASRSGSSRRTPVRSRRSSGPGSRRPTSWPAPSRCRTPPGSPGRWS